MIGIIGAMDEEVSALLNKIDNVQVEEIDRFKYFVGTIDGKDVVLTKSGVGKTLSAMVTTALVLNYDIDMLINIGSAGALQTDISVSDVIVSTRVAVSDFDISAFGYKQSFDEARYTFKADERLVNILKELELNNVHYGDMVSSDSFISTKDQVEKILVNYDTALCADMEAASIAMVLEQFKIPFIIVRSISDNIVSTEDNTIEFEEYLKVASKNSAFITRKLIEAL